MKNASQKESQFSGVLVDSYKAYAEGKVWLQENVNYLDSANKFCVCLTNGLKNQEKQQQLTGQKQTLEELALKNLPSSLSKASTTIPPVVNAVQTVSITPVPTVIKVPAVPKTVTSGATSVITTTSITSTPTTTITTVTSVASRPRGRPPGSKNQTPKATDPSKNAAMQQKLMSSLLQPFAGSLSNLEIVTAHLEPSIRSRVLSLLADRNFMTTLAMFPDPTARNTLLREYFTISQFPNVQQLIDGFNGVFGYLASALQTPTPPMANIMPSQMKSQPKVDKPTAVPSSTAMSIFPTTNKPHPSLTTSPSKSALSPSIPASITPVPSSASLLKPGASTIISVGSGQLTITPSISITPNPTKLTSVLPQMSAPSFNIQKPAQPKQRRSAGDKPAKQKNPKVPRLSQGLYPDLPSVSVESLPKSLSIIPSPSPYMTAKQSIPPQMNVGTLANKPAKQTKPKKKSLDANKSIGPTSKIPKMDPNLFNKSIANQQLQSLLNPILGPPAGYLQHFEQFLTGMPPTSIGPPKPAKTKTNTATSTAPQQKQTGAIKVKQLEQLQGRQTSKVNEKQPQKSKQTFPTPGMKNIKNPPMARSPTVLNAYGTTISSVPLPNQSMASSFANITAAASNLPASVQIRYIHVQSIELTDLVIIFEQIMVLFSSSSAQQKHYNKN